MEDLQKFFKTYYAPNNLTLVLAGDLVPERVFELARRYFERSRQEPPVEVRTQEPEQLGERQFVIRRKAQTPLLQYAYKAPLVPMHVGPAVNLLLSILVDGDSSRLHRALVEEKQLAIEVGGALAGRFWTPDCCGFSSHCPRGPRLPRFRLPLTRSSRA